MLEIYGMITGSVIVFMVMVLPIWIIMHYITKMRIARGLSKDDESALAEVWEISNRMQQRIDSLETILDEKDPNWRDKQ